MANEVTSFQVQGSKYSVKADLTFDDTPTIGSSNPVTSNGIALAVQGAAVGTDISVGRSGGTPIGYCSIAYGTNNVAAGDYGIVFGKDNICLSDNSQSYGSNLIGGGGNVLTNGRESICMGGNNRIRGVWNVAIGCYNNIGTSLSATLDTPSSENRPQPIYIGYVNLSTKKIYYDPGMTNEITVTFYAGARETYFVDLTENGNRHAGDIYIYSYTGSGSRRVYKLSSKAIMSYITFTDYRENSTFFYMGTCYYEAATDTNYTDSSKTTTINPSGRSYMAYFDTNRQEFVVAQPISFPSDGRYPRWSYFTPYHGYRTDPYTIRGRYAYVAYSTNDMDNIGKVYSSADLNPESEITHIITDGEYVCNILNGYYYQYYRDTNGNLRQVVQVQNVGLTAGWNGATYGNCVVNFGDSNYILGGGPIGGLIGGAENKVYGGVDEAIVILGRANTSLMLPNRAIGGSASGNALGSYIIGGENRVAIYEPGSTNSFSISVGQIGITGINNDIDTHLIANSGGGYITSGYIYITGDTNHVRGNSNEIYTIGLSNYIAHSIQTIVIGSSNNGASPDANFLQNSNIIGNWNNVGGIVGYSYQQIIQNEDGSYTGSNVSYNSSTGLYTFPTNTIMEMRGMASNPMGYLPKYKGEYTMGLYHSTDGHTLTPCSIGLDQYVYAFGYNNAYKRTAIGPGRTSPLAIIGTDNEVIAAYSDPRIVVIGSQIKIDSRDCTLSDSGVYTGSYNSTTGITNEAKFVVGNGTGNNARSNGLIVYSAGVTALPSSPDTIAAGVTAMSNTGVSSDKMAITYGMLRDYTGPGGGGQARPNVTTITLEETDWSNFEQTVNITGITTDSIVIVQPIGPTTFGYNNSNVYLSSVNNGSLTFGCATGPSGDISVKVVYWA